MGKSRPDAWVTLHAQPDYRKVGFKRSITLCNMEAMHCLQHPLGLWDYSPIYFFFSFELFYNCMLHATNRSLRSDLPSYNLIDLFPHEENVLL